ncbi:FecR protein [Dyadobacter jejuensis]|uniref:FecR protein n=2 Tax=Dyadobacter jejuensis TaxID=1082580 RepID=A0A316AL94_9BACT|nr:FecR protein [Dyadobacter jejuensis]
MIARYLKGELTFSEQVELRNWLEEDPNNQRLLDELEDEETLSKDLYFFSTVDKTQAWENISKELHTASDRSKWSIWKYWKYAAAAVLLMVLSYVFVLNTYTKERSDISQEQVPEPKNDVLPGGDHATLTLADGSVLSLEDMTDGTVKQEGGIRISKRQGQVVYEMLNVEEKAPVTYNTIRTPVGGQYHVILPDGSKVWLNSESSLYFPTAFNGPKRVVKLTGEGYFEIEHDSNKPFLVSTLQTDIEVLGTHFNVMAYTNEGANRTTLLEGAVKVGSGANKRTLKPGQQAVGSGDIRVIDIDPDQAVAWKNGYFQFESESLESILRQLKRWYDIELEDEHAIPDTHFTAYISRNTSLSNVLRMLELSGELKFKIEGNKVSIQEKKH